jgi:hypothetical protein
MDQAPVSHRGTSQLDTLQELLSCQSFQIGIGDGGIGEIDQYQLSLSIQTELAALLLDPRGQFGQRVRRIHFGRQRFFGRGAGIRRNVRRSISRRRSDVGAAASQPQQ